MKAKKFFLIWLITLGIFFIILSLWNKFLNNDLINSLLSLLLIVDFIAGVLSFFLGILLFLKQILVKEKKDNKNIETKEIPILKKKLVTYFLIWLFSVILFYFLLINENGENFRNESNNFFQIITYLDLLLGFVTGILVIYYVGKLKGVIISFLSGLALPIIALFSFFILNKIISPNKQNLNTSKNVNPTPQLIECFIQGKSVFTTRENCIELSKQKYHQTIIEQKPNFQLPPPPKIEQFKIEPPIIRCDNEYDFLGNYKGVKCYKSWF